MTPFGGLLSTIIKAFPRMSGFTADHGAEAHEPLLSEDESECQLYSDGTSGKLQRPIEFHRSVHQSDSYLEFCKAKRAAGVSNGLVHDLLSAQLSPKPLAKERPPCHNGRQAVSNSHVETQSYLDRDDQLNTPRQRGIMGRLSRGRNVGSLKRAQSQCENSSKERRIVRSCQMNVEWRSSTRSSSDPNLRISATTPDKLDQKPLRTCLKDKAKSADATPICETTKLFKGVLEDQKLRRRETVDFAVAVLELDIVQDDMHARFVVPRKHTLERPSRQLAVCPGTSTSNKCSLASPAVTRTDVHVVAITPVSSQSTVERAGGGKIAEAPATPTMQVMESRNGTYEIVWDDVPQEHNVRNPRQGSLAGQALEALATGSKGLEIVNTKLTEWSGTWNTPSGQFRPTMVVFPDDDSVTPQFDCAIGHGEDVGIPVPPNSVQASALHSRNTSRPASTPTSRAPSQDDSCATLRTTKAVFGEPSLLVQRLPSTPDPEVWPGHRLAACRKAVVASPERKLSNIDEADIRFRDHRDSVTLAHLRLINSGGVRPELFAHRDSVTLAKKRMYARNHTASTLRQLHRLKARSEPGSVPESNAVATTPLVAAIRAQAIDALQRETPVPILCRTDDIGVHHIQIED